MPAMNRLKRLRLLIVELPMQLRLAYCLARDPRTPAPLKAALAGALGLILNPAIDLPAWIPVVGQMDAIALTVLTVRTFNAQAPAALRSEIEAQIRAGQSQFDVDLGRGVGAAGRLARLVRSVPQRAGRRGRHAAPRPLPAHPPAWYRSPSSAGEPSDARPVPGGSPDPLPEANEEHST
ncbi:MAG: YkvA family protein [Candidatus Dormibacteria bacterium]